MKNLLCVGEMVIDFLPGEEENSYIRKAGGAPANVAIAYSSQGCAAAFCGMMGNDDFGHFLYDTLLENNVTPCIRDLTDEAITTMAFVTLDSSGERSFTFARKPGADTFLKAEHITDEIIDEASIVHAGSCSLSAGSAADATVYAMKAAHEKGKIVSFDVNYRNLMWNDDMSAAANAVMKVLPYVDMLKISEEEEAMIGGECNFTALMKENGISLIVETLGGEGAKYYWKDKTGFCQSVKVEHVVDTCGAGDAFWGSFLAHLTKCSVETIDQLTEQIIADSLLCGNIAGSLCVGKKGAIESLPTADEVKNYWRKLKI